MPLSKWTREALEWKLDVALCEVDPGNDADHNAHWSAVVKDCDAALAADTLLGHKLAADELENYLSGDCPAAERKQIIIDLARGGFLEIFDGKGFYSRRPQTILEDGVRYII